MKMKLINELLYTERSIISSLLETKFLVNRLQNELLLNWVSKKIKVQD